MAKKKSDYSEKLTNPKWQRKRLELMNLRGFKCEECGAEDKELHIHHRFYIKGREVWEYDNDVFQVLCHVCHDKAHAKEEKVKTVEVVPKKYEELIMNVGDYDLDNLNGFLNSIESEDEFNEITSLLADAINSGWLERSLDYIKDQQRIERLEICLFQINQKFKDGRVD